MAKSNGRSRKMKRRTMKGGFLESIWGNKSAPPVVNGTGTSDKPIVEPATPAAPAAPAAKSSSWSFPNIFGSNPPPAAAGAAAAGGGRRRRHKRTAKK